MLIPLNCHDPKAKNAHSDILPQNIQDSYNCLIIVLFLIFTYVAFYSIIFAFARLCRKGVDGKARRNFIVKHGAYVFVMLITWTV